MSKYIRIDLDGAGALDAPLAGEILAIVTRAIASLENPTITALSAVLDLHPQRCARIVRALELDHRFARMQGGSAQRITHHNAQ